jgi:predicted ATP-dependent endonuclease of OLD family
MSNYKFTSFHVKRYRSLIDVKIDISDNCPVVICGENNIGKTNLLRALNVFFNYPFQEDIYNPKNDIPHHIFYGSQGAGAKTELTGTFEKDGKHHTLKVNFSNNGEASYLFGGKAINFDIAKEWLSHFQFLYVESHNIDIPRLISVVLEKDGLLPLDTKRKKQSQPLEKLAEFIELSQKAISDIESDINECFKKLTDFDGILKDKQIRIHFAEFEKLRDVVKTMTSITLYDGNNHGIAFKGSGAQRAVFLALIQFISQNSKRNIIWGIDEPEAFLQPRLQKKVSDVLHEVVTQRKQPVLITTHSQHFIKLNSLKATYIFKGTISPREYKRKPNEVFYEVNTAPIDCKSDFEKASLIKQHLGISNNDGWEVLPYNILVEGEEDKKYLETLLTLLNLAAPNIVWSGGASKIAGYLQYYNHFAQELPYKPEFICIFDNDDEGRDQAKKIKTYNYISVKKVDLPRYDGLLPGKNSLHADWEIEDFLPPKSMLSTINLILKKDSYKPITQSQIRDRSKPAHSGKQILKYAEECSTQNNADKPPFALDNEGRKKQICQKFYDQAYNIDLSELLSKDQIKFLTELAK